MSTGIYSGLLKDSIPLFPTNQKYVEGLGRVWGTHALSQEDCYVMGVSHAADALNPKP